MLFTDKRIRNLIDYKVTLQTITEEAGFTEIKWVSFGESDHGSLRNLERHTDVEWMKNGFIMVCEAKK
jgi:hypothetical protein